MKAEKRRFDCNSTASVRLTFHGADYHIGRRLLAYRELDNALGLTDIAEQCLQDNPTRQEHSPLSRAQLRQSVFSRLAGYEDTNDADRLAVDPAMRQVVGGRAVERTAASTSQMGRFETEVLTTKENQAALAQLSGKWIDRVRKARKLTRIVLDMDSSVSETYGRQEGSAYNGHFGCTCYHPLFCFNQFGDLEGAMLREGNVHSAKDWKKVLDPIIARYRDLDIALLFRGDAAFANPNIYERLEAERYRYAIRLPANDVLQREIEHLLTRPVGRPPKAPVVLYHDFMYQAALWNHARRVIAKVEWHRGELFPRVGFIVTNLGARAKNVVHFYNQRGTAEQWIKEGKNAVKWTRLSCHDFADNAVQAPALRPGVQPRELPPPAGAAEADPALVDDYASGEANQDRREGSSSCAIHGLPDGGSRRTTRPVSRHSREDQPDWRGYCQYGIERQAERS